MQFCVCCPSCGLVRWCGEECRHEGIEEHEEECSRMKLERGWSDQMRLVLKIWRKISREGDREAEIFGGFRRCWDDLEDHCYEILADNKLNLKAQYSKLEAVIGPSDLPPWKSFLSIYGKVMVNCFSLRSDR